MENSSGKLAHWLAFYLCKGLGVKTLLALAQNQPLECLFELNHEQLVECGLSSQIASNLVATDWRQVDYYQALIAQSDITAINYFDSPLYPPLLKEVASAPLLLFCRGNLELLNSPQIAIVGSRHATPSGLEIAAEFAHQLTLAGLTVTSGMALGIDGAAHKGALAGNG